jgi:small subunit ribosomal protein S28
VVGRIYHVVNDDIYVDFGGKFPAVVQRNRRRRDLYARGDEVRLLVKSLEQSEKFLGYDKEMTIMEADCVLLGKSDTTISNVTAVNLL